MPGETLLTGDQGQQGAQGQGQQGAAQGQGQQGAQGQGQQGQGQGAAQFVAADAVKFLTEHGVDANSLQNVQEADLKARYESAKAIADKAEARVKGSLPKAPEKYAEVKLPGDVAVDPEIQGELGAIGKKHGLSQDAYAEVVALGAKTVQRIGKALDTQTAAVQSKWLADTQADAEIGGAKLPENLGFAAKAREAFGTPAMREFLEKTKLGNHPEMIRLFVRVGRALQEDKTVQGGQRGDDRDMASRLYGNTK
jgi:hypothetical protein